MAMKSRFVWVGLFVLSGCGASQTVSTLPSPTFAPPTVASPAPAPKVAIAASKSPAKTPVAAPVKPRVSVAQTGPRDWTPTVAARHWKWIIVHHSATPAGGAAAFDKMHKAKGWDGLGYDFVIGNGTDTADGQVEVGFRWKKQLTGAHAKTDDNRFNEYGIGICLVGNFEVDRPTEAQMQSLARLTAYLMRTYGISPNNVMGHGQTKDTLCPGKYMNLASLRTMARQIIVSGGGVVSEPEKHASAEVHQKDKIR